MLDAIDSQEITALQESPAPEALGTAGLAALEKEREARRQAERRLEAIEKQLQGLDPDQLRGFKESQEREERLRSEMDQRIKEAAEAAKAEALGQVRVKDQLLAEALAEKSELYRKQTLANAFQVAGGRSGGADDGATYFDALLAAVGQKFRVSASGEIEVINATGEPMLSDKGDPLTPTAYLETLKGHPVYGHFFAPKSDGFGGGMRGNGNVLSGSVQGMSAIEKIGFGLGA
jgi:hypothetical protein